MTPRSHERIAVFPGSFNPFTLGHASIVERGLRLFDSIIICVGVNINKPGERDCAQQRCEQIAGMYAAEPRVRVVCNEGLTAPFALKCGASALLRGVRSVKDFEYERDIADANRELYGLDTVVLYAEARLSWISSSLVRELRAYGEDLPDNLNCKI